MRENERGIKGLVILAAGKVESRILRSAAMSAHDLLQTSANYVTRQQQTDDAILV
jgi:hypothetical protein